EEAPGPPAEETETLPREKKAKALSASEMSSTSSRPAAVPPPASHQRRRQAQLRKRAPRVAGRALVGSPFKKRARSSARSAALAWRAGGFWRRQRRHTASRSRGTRGSNRRGGTGSSVATLRRTSTGLSAWNGGRPVSNS